MSFLVIGSLMLAFVAYQLWGTALYEHNAQDRLRSELVGHLKTSHLSVKSSPRPSSGSSAPSTSSASADSPTIGAGVQSPATGAITAPSEGSPIGLLSIPRIGMSDEAFVEGTAEADLQEGPGHYSGTALPGESGNVAIAGHRTTYGAPFYNLDELQPGDPVYLQVAQGTYRYDVVRSLVVNPSDTSVLAASAIPVLTLTTCNPRYSASTRLVVTAILQSAPSAAPVVVASHESAGSGSPGTSSHPKTSKTRHASSSLSDNSSKGNVNAAFLWGELTLIAFFVARIAWRLIGNRARWGVVGVGAPFVAISLFVFFEQVSLALPASF